MTKCDWCEKEFEKGFTAELWNNKGEHEYHGVYCSSYCRKESLTEYL
jgi:hypothetical protein